MERHYAEASDDARRVTVGLQDASRQAEIYAEHAHLYTEQQLEELAHAREAAETPRERVVLNRLWFEAADALAARDLVQEAQDLTNERLAWRVDWDGAQVSLNMIGALLAAEPDYGRRDALFALDCIADEHFAPRDLDLAGRSQEIRSEIFGLDGEIGIAQSRMGSISRGSRPRSKPSPT